MKQSRKHFVSFTTAIRTPGRHNKKGIMAGEGSLISYERDKSPPGLAMIELCSDRHQKPVLFVESSLSIACTVDVRNQTLGDFHTTFYDPSSAVSTVIWGPLYEK